MKEKFVGLLTGMVFLVSCSGQQSDQTIPVEEKVKKYDVPEVIKNIREDYPVSNERMQEIEFFIDKLKEFKGDLRRTYDLFTRQGVEMKDVLQRESLGYLAYSVQITLELAAGVKSLLQSEMIRGGVGEANQKVIETVIQPYIASALDRTDGEIEFRGREAEVGRNTLLGGHIDRHLGYQNKFKELLKTIQEELSLDKNEDWQSNVP